MASCYARARERERPARQEAGLGIDAFDVLVEVHVASGRPCLHPLDTGRIFTSHKFAALYC